MKSKIKALLRKSFLEIFLTQKCKKIKVVQNCHKPNAVKSSKEHRKEAPVIFKHNFTSHRYWVFQVYERFR